MFLFLNAESKLMECMPLKSKAVAKIITKICKIQHIHCSILKNMPWYEHNQLQGIYLAIWLHEHVYYRVFNLKVDRQLSREYFVSDAIYNGSADMTLY